MPRRISKSRTRSKPYATSKWGSRAKYLEETYGITEGEYERLLSSQGGGCAICGNPPKTRRLAVDHCHKTGAVRGLLCKSCNRGLAYYYDRPERFDKAAEYLRSAVARVAKALDRTKPRIALTE